MQSTAKFPVFECHVSKIMQFLCPARQAPKPMSSLTNEKFALEGSLPWLRCPDAQTTLRNTSRKWNKSRGTVFVPLAGGVAPWQHFTATGPKAEQKVGTYEMWQYMTKRKRFQHVHHEIGFHAQKIHRTKPWCTLPAFRTPPERKL